MESNHRDYNECTREEFLAIENFGANEPFNSLIIVPTNDIHESGYRCMKFILLKDEKIVGAVGGWSDIVYPNGIGNYGKVRPNYGKNIPYMGLSIDCLKSSGCVRLLLGQTCHINPYVFSSFEFYTVESEGDI